MKRHKLFEKREDDYSSAKSWHKFFFNHIITWPLGLIFKNVREPLSRPKRVRKLDTKDGAQETENSK